MDLVNQIRSNFPKTIDKGNPIFSALIANDNKDAVIQSQLEYMLNYMKEWTSTPDVYKQTGLMLKKTITFFSYLEQFADETEQSLKNRFRAIFVRNHDTKWGTPYDVKSVFKQYFPHAEIYLVENVNKIDAVEPGLANYLLDGDIDTSTPTDWTLTDCSATKDARFSKGYGIQMDQAGGVLTQTVTVPNRAQIGETEEYKHFTYFLHFFMSGMVNVQIYNSSNGKYWDYANKEWKSSAVSNIYGNIEWNDCSLYFTTVGNDDTTDITITFNYVVPEIAAELQNAVINGLLPVTWAIDNCNVDGDGVIELDQSDSEVSTTANIVPQKNYTLNFAYKGRLAITIQNDNGKYWDVTNQEWKSESVTNNFRSIDWIDKALTVIPETEDTTISVSFTYVNGAAYLKNANINGELPETETKTDCTNTGNIINLEQMTSKVSYVADVHTGESYKLKYNYSGRLNVVIKNDNNEYWSVNSNSWEASLVENEILSNSLTEKELTVIANSDTTELTIEYTLIDKNYLDYFRLFQKQPYSSFTVIAHFTGNTSMGAFGLAAGDADPNDGSGAATPPQPRYGRYGYYDKSFLSGLPIGFASDIYEDLLDYLRSQGVRAFLDIIIKDAE